MKIVEYNPQPNHSEGRWCIISNSFAFLPHFTLRFRFPEELCSSQEDFVYYKLNYSGEHPLSAQSWQLLVV